MNTMTYNYHRRVACPICERGEMVQVHPFLARCLECGGTISYDFFKTLRQIGNLSEATGERGHPPRAAREDSNSPGGRWPPNHGSNRSNRKESG